MISKLDKKVIKFVELNARADRNTMASSLSISLEELNESLNNLRHQGVIGQSNAVINTTKLGFNGIGVFLKLKKTVEREEVLTFLNDNPFVYWISLNKSEYDVIFAIQARDNIELNDILSFIVSRLSNFVKSYDLATRLQFNHFPRKYLPGNCPEDKDVLWGKDRPINHPLTENQRYVLNVLSKDGSLTEENISKETGIVTKEVREIIADLESRGIIAGYHTAIYPEKYGYHTYQLLLTRFLNNKEFSNALLRFCELHPNVTVLVQSVGSWNYEITVEVSGKEALNEFVAELKDNFSDIDNIITVSVQNYYFKYRLGYPPIKESSSEMVLKEINDEDFIALKELIRRTHEPPQDFEYCEGYILQATRNFPRVIYHNENIAFVSRKDTNPDSNYVVILADGFDQIGMIKKVCKFLYLESLSPVILKNIGEVLEDKLKSQEGFRGYKEDEQWNEYARYDDNTHPQILIHNKTFLDLEGPEYQKLREKLNWFDRRYNLEVIPYSSEYHEIFDQLLYKWSEQMHNMHGVTTEELVKSHLMYRDVKDYYYQYLLRDKQSQKWAGFLCASSISETTCGFNALLNDFEIKESYRKMMYKMIEISTRLGFLYTNLQGSETEEQFETKEWFVPQKLIHKKHLVYEEN